MPTFHTKLSLLLSTTSILRDFFGRETAEIFIDEVLRSQILPKVILASLNLLKAMVTGLDVDIKEDCWTALTNGYKDSFEKK